MYNNLEFNTTVSNTNTNTNTSTNSIQSSNENTTTKSFLDYMAESRDEISYQDTQIQEQLLEVLEELNHDIRENFYDGLVNNIADDYLENKSSIATILSAEENTIDKLADVVDQMENCIWLRL